MSGPIHVVTIRPTHLHGRRVEAGTRLQLTLADAHALVTNHKAQLCDPEDGQAIRQAVQQADLTAARSSPGYIPPVQPPY